jgi:hypothetical protein
MADTCYKGEYITNFNGVLNAESVLAFLLSGENGAREFILTYIHAIFTLDTAYFVSASGFKAHVS